MKIKKKLLEEHFSSIKDCKKCSLCKHRTNIVYGKGNPEAKILLVGEGPGFFEDKKGLPFVGQAGEKLDECLVKAGLDENLFYWANIVKCRPWDKVKNRPPVLEEANQCLPYLYRQIRIVEPSYILCLGKTAASFLLKKEIPSMEGIRKKWCEKKYPTLQEKVKIARLLVTYHPAYILRNLEKEKDLIDDLCFLGNLLFEDEL